FELVEERFLRQVRLPLDVGPRAGQLALQHFAFRVRSEIGSCAHRQCPCGRRGKRGQHYLRMVRNRAAQSRQYSCGSQDPILHSEYDFANAREAFKESPFFCWIGKRQEPQYFRSPGPKASPGSQSAGHRRPLRYARTMRSVSSTLRPTLIGQASAKITVRFVSSRKVARIATCSRSSNTPQALANSPPWSASRG